MGINPDQNWIARMETEVLKLLRTLTVLKATYFFKLLGLKNN